MLTLTKQYFVKVPVLIITKGRVNEELLTIWRRLRGEENNPSSSPLSQANYVRLTTYD